MEKKKSTVATVLLLIAVLVIGAMAGYIYMQKNEAERRIEELETEKAQMQEKIDNLQGKIDVISNKINSNENIEVDNIQDGELNEITHIIVNVEDTSGGEQIYKSKKIYDKDEIKKVINIVNNAVELSEIGFDIYTDLDEYPSTIDVYDINGKKCTIAAPGDEINNNGDLVNVMTKWYSEDGKDKTIFKVEIKLSEYIENLYNKY